MRAMGVVILVILACGCATKYRPTGMTGGFSETRLDENIFRVTFRGNGYTRPERAADMALLRSAELTLVHGYKYFAIVDASQGASYSAISTPSTSYTTAQANYYGNYAYGTATTTTNPGQTYLIAKPSSTNTIVCFTERPTNIMTYSAEFLRSSLGPKYGLRVPATMATPSAGSTADPSAPKPAWPLP